MEKSIDLGKLQQSLENQEKILKKYESMLKNAKTALLKAERVYDTCAHNVQSARLALDKSRDRVLEAARTVASS